MGAETTERFYRGLGHTINQDELDEIRTAIQANLTLFDNLQKSTMICGCLVRFDTELTQKVNLLCKFLEDPMLKKKFFKSKPTCQVTFQLPSEVEAKEVTIVGEFNGWDRSATPLKKVKSVWKTTLELEKDKSYQFRYLVNGSEWYNDDAADSYVPNNISGDNSVVVTYNN